MAFLQLFSSTPSPLSPCLLLQFLLQHVYDGDDDADDDLHHLHIAGLALELGVSSPVVFLAKSQEDYLLSPGGGKVFLSSTYYIPSSLR